MKANGRKSTTKIKSSLWRRPQNRQTQGAKLEILGFGSLGAAGLQNCPNREMPGLTVATQCQ